MPKLAVLVSGDGSNLKAILEYGLCVSVVIADRPCPALVVARMAGVPTMIIERGFGPHFDRDAFTMSTLSYLRHHSIDFVAMAGFKTILGGLAFERFSERILNLHPSLLPRFKGAHAVRDALMSGEKVTGCTVHLATSQLDEGRILVQQEVPILDTDTVESLHERIKLVERTLYAPTIEAYIRAAL